jgi:hypothetical protein
VQTNFLNPATLQGFGRALRQWVSGAEEAG